MRKKKLTKKRVLDELCAIGFARVSDYLTVGKDGLTIRPTEELPAGCDAAIAAVENTSTGIRLKFYDKMKALELLGKALGLFEGGGEETQENNLLAAILSSTAEPIRTGDLPELEGGAD